MNDDFLSEKIGANWPEDIQHAYNVLKIPSLYDALLANEKMSLEMRRQEREIRHLTDEIHSHTNQLNSMLKMAAEEWEMEDELEENEHEGDPTTYIREIPEDQLTDLEIQLLEEKQAFLDKRPQILLMQAYDALYEHSYLTKQFSQQLMDLFPQKEGVFSQKPHWVQLAENLIRHFIEQIEHSRYKFLQYFDENSIEIIEPLVGDLFDPIIHRRIDSIGGSKSGTIAQVSQIGYQTHHQILRKSDVIVYQ